MNLRIIPQVFALLLFAVPSLAAEPLRPPAVPLVTHDPYFSIWSPADKLTDADTMHWTGKPHRLTSLVRIDGKTYCVMGSEPVQVAVWTTNKDERKMVAVPVPVMEQKSLTVLPTRTVYVLESGGLELKLTFLTPTLPDDLEVLSRPVTYLTYDFRSTDGKSHEVAFYFDASPELAVDTPSQQVLWAVPQAVGRLAVLKVGSKDQPVLAKKGDDLRIDWGSFCLASPANLIYSVASARLSRGSFASNMPLPVNAKPLQAQRAGEADVGYFAACSIIRCAIRPSVPGRMARIT